MNQEEEQDPEEWAAANLRLLRAGLRSGDQKTLDAVKDRIKAKHGDLLGEGVYQNLELICLEEIIKEREEKIFNDLTP